MSEMPERIWADEQPCRGSATRKTLFAGYGPRAYPHEYVRADLYADLERQRDELIGLIRLIDIDEGIDCMVTHDPAMSEELKQGLRQALASMEKDDG